MLKWAHSRVRSRTFSNKVDAKIEFRCCMDRLTRDLKLYRIAPQDLIKVRHKQDREQLRVGLAVLSLHEFIFQGFSFLVENFNEK